MHKGVGKVFKLNKLRNWSKAKGSYFVIKGIDSDIPTPPDPIPDPDEGYILQENGYVVLDESKTKLIIE